MKIKQNLIGILLASCLLGCTKSAVMPDDYVDDYTAVDTIKAFSRYLPDSLPAEGELTYEIIDGHPLIEQGRSVSLGRLQYDSNSIATLWIECINVLAHEAELRILVDSVQLGYRTVRYAIVGDSYVDTWITGGGLIEITELNLSDSTVSGRFALELWNFVFNFRHKSYITIGAFNRIPLYH